MRAVRHDVKTTFRAMAYLHYHDPLTFWHGIRSAILTARLTRRMRLRPDEARQITFAALLHDVGKMETPLEVLNKPGPLTIDEWDVMRLHAEAGERFLYSVTRDWLTAPLVRAHHEHYDGSGYPDGLRRGDIPLGGRVLHVVDVWDALITARPYKPAIDRRNARLLMTERMQHHFDPDILALFLEEVAEREGDSVWYR